MHDSEHMQADPVRFLEGYTALDLTDLKGQLCGRFLADLGMEVIKVEPPAGDPARRLPPFLETSGGGEVSLPFAHLNANKKSVVLDLESEEGRIHFADLICKADVLLESYSPGFLDAMGFGFQQLSRLNPRLVMCSITGFGQTGPGSGYAYSDIVVFAMSGLMHISGDPDLPPCKPPETQAYYFGSLMGALGTVAALYQRQETGKGNWVDVSMQEALATQEHSIRLFANEQRTVKRDGSQHANVAPARIFPCRDGYVYIYVSRRHWKILLEVWKDHPAELDDPDWIVDPFRRSRADTINERVAEFTSRYTKEALTALLQGHGIPCVPVNRPRDFISDEQIRARRFFTRVRYSPSEEITQPSAPFLINGKRPRLDPAPALGEHQNEIAKSTPGDSKMRSVARANEGAPLAGLRILSFDQVLAGPYGVMLLAELGAGVIKVESRRGGLDLFRFFGASQDPNLSPRFLEFNRNKRSVTVNLKSAEGPGVVADLARHCDVVMDNFSAHVMPSLRLDYEDLVKVKPDIITLRMPGLGCTGPKKGYATLGTNITAFTGFTYLWNHEGHSDPPVGSQIVLPDYVSGLMAASLMVAAVLWRNRTGRGAFIDLAQAEAASYLMGPSLMQAVAAGEEPRPAGNSASFAAPQSCYPCRGEDRWCVIAIENDAQWRALVQEIGHEHVLRDAKFDNLEGRLRHRSQIDPIIEAWTRQRDRQEVMRRLQRVGVPCGLVQDGADLVSDPHLNARGFIVAQDNPRLGRVVLPGCPIRFASYNEEPFWEFPVLGRDNEEVFKDLLGYSSERITELEKSGALE